MKEICIKEIGKIVTGKTPRTSVSENYGGSIPFITPTDLNGYKYLEKTASYLTARGLKEVQNCLLPSGTVCFTCIGNIGNVVKVLKPSVTNQQFNSVIANSNYDSDYVYYILKLVGTLLKGRIGSNSTVLPIISKSKFEEIRVTVEDNKNNQYRLTRILSLVDDKIMLNTRMNAELESMAKQLYDYWFVQFDFPDENGKPYKSSGGKMVYNEKLKREIPEGWEVKCLNDLTETSKDSINPFEKPDKEYKHYSIPAYDACGSYSLEKGEAIQSNKFVVHKGQILVPKLNPWYNRIVMVDTNEDAICSTEFVILEATEEYSKGFIFYVVKTDRFITYCTKGSTGTSHSQRRVPPEILKGFKIPYNEKIVSLFSHCVIPQINLINENLKQIRNLTHLRDSLLPMLMNGQVTIE